MRIHKPHHRASDPVGHGKDLELCIFATCMILILEAQEAISFRSGSDRQINQRFLYVSQSAEGTVETDRKETPWSEEAEAE